MAQLIELEEVVLHAVIFKMGCDDVGVRVVRRVLDRAEVGDILVLRNDDQAAGMLAGGALDAHQTGSQAVFFGAGSLDTPLFKILLDIAVGGLLGQGPDGAGAENVVRAEERLSILMGLGLILTREVQVDIRGLFVSGVAQEGLKGDVEAVTPQRGAAEGAVFLRHVGAAAVGGQLFGEHRRAEVRFVPGFGTRVPAQLQRGELRIAALRADIVRRERVDLGDAAHPGDHRGADAAPAADQIAVLQRVLHQLLGAHVDDVIVVIEDRLQFGIDALLHHRGRDLAVNAVHLAVNQVFQLFGRVFDFRREQPLRQELDLLDLIGDGPGVGDDHLAGGLLAQVLKLRQHLFRVAEVDRALPVGVGEFFGGKKDTAVLLVLGVEEMHVGSRDHRLAQFPAEAQNRAVIVLQDLFPADAAVFDQKGVVADRLDLEIVVKGGNFLQLFIALAAHDGAVQFAHPAGRADQKAVPVGLKQASRDIRRTVKVLQI